MSFKKDLGLDPEFGLEQAVHACQILAYDVELEVHHGAYLEVVEVGVLEGVGNDAYLEGVFRGAAYGEGDAIDGDAALVHAEVAAAHHVLAALVLEGELPGALLVVDGNATGRLVDMPLHYVAVQAAVHEHGTLHIDLVAHGEQTYIGALQSLAHGGDGVGAVLKAHHGEADAVVRHALVNTQLLYEGA